MNLNQGDYTSKTAHKYEDALNECDGDNLQRMASSHFCIPSSGSKSSLVKRLVPYLMDATLSYLEMPPRDLAAIRKAAKHSKSKHDSVMGLVLESVGLSAKSLASTSTDNKVKKAKTSAKKRPREEDDKTAKKSDKKTAKKSDKKTAKKSDKTAKKSDKTAKKSDKTAKKSDKKGKKRRVVCKGGVCKYEGSEDESSSYSSDSETSEYDSESRSDSGESESSSYYSD